LRRVRDTLFYWNFVSQVDAGQNGEVKISSSGPRLNARMMRPDSSLSGYSSAW
jgi:hypothetical protein